MNASMCVVCHRSHFFDPTSRSHHQVLNPLYSEHVLTLTIKVGAKDHGITAEPADVKIDRPVIKLVPVSMMHNFPWFELAPEFPFHNKTMNQFTRVTNPLVALVVDV